MTEVWSVDDPAQVGFCGARTLVRTRRQFEHVSGPKKGQRSKVETVYHVSSVPIDVGHGKRDEFAETQARLIYGDPPEAGTKTEEVTSC